MTDPQTTPIPVAAARTQAPGGEVLARATDVELLGEVPGSGYRQPPALARRGDGQVITLTPLLHQVLVAVDGRRTVADVADAVSAASGRLVRPEDVQQLVQERREGDDLPVSAAGQRGRPAVTRSRHLAEQLDVRRARGHLTSRRGRRLRARRRDRDRRGLRVGHPRAVSRAPVTG